MLFYTSILVASLIAVLLASFFYKSIANKNRSVNASYQRNSIAKSSSNHQKRKAGFKTCIAFSTQPVKGAKVVYSNMAKKLRDEAVDCHNQDTAWLVRENRFLSMYESYTARRSTEPEPRTLAMVSKPFRREVES